MKDSEAALRVEADRRRRGPGKEEEGGNKGGGWVGGTSRFPLAPGACPDDPQGILCAGSIRSAL